MSDNIVKLRPHIQRAADTRATLAKRFIEAQEEETNTAEGPIGFPCYLSMTSIRVLKDGSLSVTFTIPQDFVKEAFMSLTDYADESPLAVTVEKIDLSEFDA